MVSKFLVVFVLGFTIFMLSCSSDDPTVDEQFKSTVGGKSYSVAFYGTSHTATFNADASILMVDGTPAYSFIAATSATTATYRTLGGDVANVVVSSSGSSIIIS